MCLLVLLTSYSTLGLEKHFLDYTVTESNKTMLANKGNSRSSLHVQLTVHIHLTIQ